MKASPGAYPKGERLKGKAWHYWQILDLAAVAFRGTQVLACLAMSTVMKEKSFKALVPGINVMK